MRKIVRYAIVINILLALLFIYSNYTLWNLVNGNNNYFINSHWSPLGISAPHYTYSNGTLSIVQTVYLYWNTPFWIFWVLLIANLYFILKISKETKQTRNEMPKN
jgi:hypothetical protein